MAKEYKVTECKCDACRGACRLTPCVPTPADVLKLIAAGFKDRLTIYFWADLENGRMLLPYVSPIKELHGCTFFTKEELCELHDAGLKPSEGKIVDHTRPYEGLHRAIVYAWYTPLGVSVFKFFDEALGSYIEKEFLPRVKMK